MSLFRAIISRTNNFARPSIFVRSQSTDVSSDFFNENQGEQDDFEPEPHYGNDDRDNGSGGFSYQQQQHHRVNKGINRVELLGGVAGDPIFKLTQRGSEFASFNLYTNVDKKLSNGETMTMTEVHNIVGFGGLAKYIKNNIQRGSRIYLTGRLHYTGGKILPDGSRSTRLASINADNIYQLAQRSRYQQNQRQNDYNERQNDYNQQQEDYDQQ